MNHLASCAPPSCSCHPPQHICHWEKKKHTHPDRKPHPNKLLHDTMDHFFKLKFICRRNGGLSLWAHVWDCGNPHTGGKWWRPHIQNTRAHTQKLRIVPVRPLDFFMWGQWFFQYTPLCYLWADTRHCWARS